MTQQSPQPLSVGPKITAMITSSLSPDPGQTSPVAWVVGEKHPISPNMSVIAMFEVSGGIEVYSASPERKGIRDFIPIHWVRNFRESMPFDVFMQELDKSERGEDDDDDDDYDDEPDAPEETPATVPPPPNGQPTP